MVKYPLLLPEPPNSIKLYHITLKDRIGSIMNLGLLPMWDKFISSKEFKEGSVVNLIERSNLHRVMYYFLMILGIPRNTLTILEVEVDPRNVLLVHHNEKEDLFWYISKKKIPPSKIRVGEIL